MMNKKTRSILLLFTICLASVVHAREPWREACGIANELHYELNCAGFAKSGDDAYFIGRKALSAKYPSQPLTLLHLKLTSKSLDECLPIEKIKKYFPEGFRSPWPGCFALNQQGTRLAIGLTTVTLTNERKTVTSILLADLAGKTIRPLVDNQQDNRDYLFSPDGRFLLFRSYLPPAELLAMDLKKVQSYSVSVVEVESGKVTVLKPMPDGLTDYATEFPAAWTSDSQQVVFHYLRPTSDLNIRWEIIACRIKDLEEKILMKKRFQRTSLFFVDENRFITGASGEIDLVNVKTGQLQNLVSLEKNPISEMRQEGNSIEYRTGINPNYIWHKLAIPSE